MKSILGLIAGSLVGWLICGYFTDNYSMKRFSMYLVGTIVGYFIGRRNPKVETLETE